MLIFAFLFSTILLPLVDHLESQIKSRPLSVLMVTISIISAIIIFLKSFASGMLGQAREFSSQIETKGVCREPKFISCSIGIDPEKTCKYS